MKAMDSQKEYYASKFAMLSNDCKMTWKLLRDITGEKANKSNIPNYLKKKLNP